MPAHADWRVYPRYAGLSVAELCGTAHNVVDEPQETGDPLRRDSDALPVRPGERVRALGLADDLRREGATALGEGEIANPKELAEVALDY